MNSLKFTIVLRLERKGGVALEKVAIVQEWIHSRAGSEKVFERLASIFPSADLFALTSNPGVDLKLGGRKVSTSFLDLPAIRDKRGITLPIMPAAWKAFDWSGYSKIVLSHHALSTSVARWAECPTYAYVHTPARYIWNPELDPRGAKPQARLAARFLKTFDEGSAKRLASVVANSTEVQGRISDNWGVSSAVIHPPVDLSFFTPPVLERSRGYLLGFSRWVEYKKLDIVLEVGLETGLPVVIAGAGANGQELKALACKLGVDATFVESPTDAEVKELYQGARALVFPAYEDFGIIPVEAQACGTPVIGVNAGGLLDTVIDGVTGILVDRNAPIVDYAEACSMVGNLRSSDCRENALQFSPEVFDKNVTRWLCS